MNWIMVLSFLACRDESVDKAEVHDVVEVEPSIEPCDTEIYYMDADGDGFGNSLRALESCDPIEGYVQNNLDCNDDNPEEFPDQTWYLDADGDGFGSATDFLIQCAHPVAYVRNFDDCDDLDSSKHPNAVWYTDGDGDGFGDPALEIASCSDVSTAVSNNQDCDDSNDAIHPLSTEICDYIDNDCDGFLDNDDSDLNEYGEVALYMDLDGDGFGTDEYVGHACPSSPLGATIQGDCDDGDAEVFPTAFEWPDSVDSNCDGESFFQSVDYFSEGYTYDSERLLGSELLYQDLNGDGNSDLIVGEIGDNNNTGTVFWISGTQVPDFGLLDSSVFAWTGANQGDEFGSSMAVIDDLTNDGAGELLVGAPGAGTVYLFDGSISGTTSDALWSWTSATGSSSDFGRSILSLGDIDGDGDAEFVVSDSLHDGTKSNQGAIFVLSTSDIGLSSDPVDSVYVLGNSSNDWFGFDIANVNDVDGDGIVDILVSATKNGPVNPGITYLVSAADLASGLIDLQTAVSFEGMTYQQAGTRLGGIGDFNGDGYQDFAIKAGSIWGSSTELGTLYIIHGQSGFAAINLLEDADVKIDSTTTGNEFADQMLAVGDLNLDGYDDLLFSNPLSEYPLLASNNNHGVVFGVYGGTYTGTFTTVERADFALTGPDNWTNLGTNLVHAGDRDMDGLSDFWISSRYGLYLLSGSTLNSQ